MYFLRWIAGYPILIILLVVGLYALYNKDNFAHWMKKNEVTEQVSEAGQSAQHQEAAEETTTAETAGDAGTDVPAPAAEVVMADTAEKNSRQPVTEPSMPVPEMEATPETEEVPPMPEMGGMPPMDAVPPFPEMAGEPPMPPMGDFPPMAEMEEMPPMPEMEEMPPMPEMKEFPPMEPFPEMPMEPAFAPPMEAPADMPVEHSAAAEPVKEAAPEVVAEAGEAAKTGEKSGSWLDIFKRKDKEETKEAGDPAQQEQAETTTGSSAGTEVAKTEKEEKSGSWLDIFKRKKEEPEESEAEQPADAAPAVQQQQQESLRLAREAFWKRDFDAAEAIYANMTKAQPDNAELLGEYGNVLLQAGKMDKALDVYEQVAELLIAQGRTFELRPLLYFIGDQDPERARRLSEKMQSQKKADQ